MTGDRMNEPPERVARNGKGCRGLKFWLKFLKFLPCAGSL